MIRFLGVAIAFVIAATTLSGCTQPDQAIQVLTRDGYTEIYIEGYDWFGCSEDDTFRTKFSAIKNGQKVQGVVCSGYFKGSTVRVFN